MVKRKAERDAIARTKKRHILEEEQRNTGLKKSISASNKGFALLAAMGFKPGMTLGKTKVTTSDSPTDSGVSETSASSTGPLIEPLALILKKDGRGGLGLAADKEEKAKERLKAYVKKGTEKTNPHILMNDFRKKKCDDFKLKAVRNDLARSRRACRQMDLENGLMQPENKLFWPPVEPADDENASSNDDRCGENDLHEDEVILHDLTKYLRIKYFYCVWCGCRYQDGEDLTDCPGDSREFHDDG
ncbi:G patch domain-containing protein 11-like isoform X2 [Varroa jacobsoni]|nr:G patch domain-containing protein 11-like isoform X3 [Varroa destructor]XP_022657869.1 G patch domain-containing protein 11-like isoform X3 [Varroa destructor]XP_022657870.1 G patch domain-containing protein 11-like isoform X3 [Varroa destructor]XP_022700559.1 G patch domain-containing protein 11-like isoform X2 [Varroa jacobsoni]XP_022700560.1 G patch domain-containing protein 11-like isoform X2 [Varroa jacobsoni]XP_022700562.1 G patch domain-containing protein 11-like isoform X2 [Varroa j